MRLVGVFGIVAVTGAVMGLAMGCDGGTETEPAAPNPLESEAGFCEKFAEAVCLDGVVKACYLSDDANLEEDKAKCIELASQRSFCNPLDYPYDPDGAQACIDATAALYDQAELTAQEIVNQRLACLAVFSAGGAVGSPCAQDHECDGAAGLRCVTKVSAEGTCQVPAEVEPGFDCSSPDSVCAEGFYCNESENCVAKEDIGSTCTATQPCVDDAICTSDVCLEKAANGEICSAASECLGGFCLKKGDAATGQCGAFIPLTFDGQACVPLTP